MSNIFKFYINNNNKLECLYLFIKNKYLENNEGLFTVDQLNDKLFIFILLFILTISESL
mgnify:CR=1 FL=1